MTSGESSDVIFSIAKYPSTQSITHARVPN